MTVPREIVFTGTAEELKAVLMGLPAILAGTAPDPLGLARGLQLRMGVALLSQIQQDFVVKARGGTGRDGVTWPKLAPSTIARRLAKEAGARKGKKASPFAGVVEILRDTGELFRSLSPGVDAAPSGADGQVFRLSPGRVTVGTNKKPWHQDGNARLPARKMWPDGNKIPPAWMPAIRRAYARGVAEILEALAKGRTP